MWFFRKKHPYELEAMRMANVIQHQLTRLNLAYREKVDGYTVEHRVEFVEPLIAKPDEFRFEVDMSRMPRGVHITDLRDQKVLETLTVACKYPVRAEHKKGAGGGFWIVVELEEHSKIPRLVKFSDMELPDNAPALSIPIGVGENGKQRWEDLRALPHLLIAGATGQGKSVAVNAILCHLARRMSPDRLHLFLVDLKGGMELSFYKPLPHVKAFITRSKQLPGFLRDLQSEMDRRTQIMEGKARDIDEYNDQVEPSRQLPYLVAVIDEIANAMLCRDKLKIEVDDPDEDEIAKRTSSVKMETESLLADLAARARATGIHLIISTQRPSVDVVTGIIKANFPCRIAFGTSSEVDSRVIIDDGSAHGLPYKGRMKFRRNIELIDLQGPLIESGHVKRLVGAISRGEILPQEPKTKGQKLREQCGLLLAIGAKDFGGRMPVVKLTKHPTVVKLGLSRYRVDELIQHLAKAKILRRGWMRGTYHIAVPLKTWCAKYPNTACDLRPVTNPVPRHQRAPEPIFAERESPRRELGNQYREPVSGTRGPEPGTEPHDDPPAPFATFFNQDSHIDGLISAAEDQRAVMIRELAKAGKTRTEIASMLGMRKKEGLALIRSILGPSRTEKP